MIEHDEDERVVRIHEVTCIAESYHDSGDRKAICVSGGELDGDVWFPYSQVHADSEVYEKGDSGTLVVTEFIADKKELI